MSDALRAESSLDTTHHHYTPTMNDSENDGIDGEHSMIEDENDEGKAIVLNIASFLTISDAASMASGLGNDTPAEGSWAVGTPFDPQRWSAVNTPPTPALVAVSPNSDIEFGEDFDDSVVDTIEEKRRNWAQEKLAAAVFEHPQSLKSYCLDAYRAAKEVNHSQSISCKQDESPETEVEPRRNRKRRRQRYDRIVIIHFLVDQVMNNVPLSVFLDILEGFRETSLDTSFAAVRVTNVTIHRIVNALVNLVGSLWDHLVHFNPFELLHVIVSRPFNAMGKTTEVVVSGIQSVATGVGSASSLALHRLSTKTAGSSSSTMLGQQNSLRRVRSREKNVFNTKLLRKLSSLNSAASVVSYTEIKDDTGGLSRHAKSRVQRMMHYEVSLRPFVATVKLPINETLYERSNEGSNYSGRHGTSESHDSEADASSASSSPQGSPFMCTPQSFPPTPSSRRMVLARGTRFADDVVFLARDQLRVHDALDSENERTREMAEALTQGKRLAVFDADDASAGIEMTCGQHVATKVGNMLYCSTRSMVPILRNCFVYFEMTVLPRPGGNTLIPQVSMATLSVGLSTKEMPPNTLVGAWKGSVGLCTTGQILTAGQWCSPADPTFCSYGDRATVGCLVCLDDGSAFETWDGVMVTAAVTFNVNQQVVSPPISAMPMVPTGGVYPSLFEQRSQATPVGPSSFTLPLLVPAEEELYPTVTLHSPGTAVMCRFSAGDTIAKSREAIGAPPGVTVYSVDGSVIMIESDEHSLAPLEI
jgi:hypothetical protein